MTTKIIGTGSYVPEHIVRNDDLAKIIDTNDEWIRTRTGIRERRITVTGGSAQMAGEAAKKAIEDAGINPEEIDIIVVATSSPDNAFPSDACAVQTAVGAVNAAAFDLSAACTGFIFALNTVHAYLKAGIYQTGLVVGADCISKLVDWEDRSTCVLFGDGAGAVVVRADETGLINLNMGADGTKGSLLACVSRTNDNFLTGKKPKLGYTTMDGQEVFKFAVKTVPQCIRQVMEGTSVELDDIKYFVLHQANYRIFEAIAKRMDVSMDKIPVNIDRYGNTSAATIPMMLDELNRKGQLESGDRIVLAGFGGGLTWGAALIEW